MLKGRLVPAALPHTQGEGQGKDPKVKNDPLCSGPAQEVGSTT